METSRERTYLRLRLRAFARRAPGQRRLLRRRVSGAGVPSVTGIDPSRTPEHTRCNACVGSHVSQGGRVSAPADQITEAAQRLVFASCQRQGIEPKITDPVVIGKVAALVGSDVPDGRYTVRVEAVKAAAGRSDRDVVDQDGEDRPSTCERQTSPGVPQG